MKCSISHTFQISCSVLISFPNVRTLAHAPTAYSAPELIKGKKRHRRKSKYRIWSVPPPSRELRQWIRKKVNLNCANPKINYAYPKEQARIREAFLSSLHCCSQSGTAAAFSQLGPWLRSTSHHKRRSLIQKKVTMKVFNMLGVKSSTTSELDPFHLVLFHFFPPSRGCNCDMLFRLTGGDGPVLDPVCFWRLRR